MQFSCIIITMKIKAEKYQGVVCPPQKARVSNFECSITYVSKYSVYM